MDRRAPRTLAACLALLALIAACAPAVAPAPVPSAAAPPAPTAAAPAAPTTAPVAAAPAAPSRPQLATTPAVDLTVNVLPVQSFGPYYVAQARGYFKEVGLNVQFFNTSNLNEALPALAQGQIQVGGCSTSIGCYNALNRRADMQIVADLQSAGKTEKSTGNSALVVRKDLWDNGTIREPRDLIGRPIYNIAGPGSGHHVLTAHWLKAQGIDPREMEWPRLPFPEILAAMTNRGIEVGVQTEPLLHAGTVRGVHQIMATQEEMNPTTEVLYVTYWSGIERLGPQVGERFMVAYLKAVRDQLNAFEYGIDQDAIIDILVRETAINDPAIYKQIKYTWVDPNGALSRESLQADADLLYELGVAQQPIDLSPAFEDKYRRFAVEYLGEYQPPR